MTSSGDQMFIGWDTGDPLSAQNLGNEVQA